MEIEKSQEKRMDKGFAGWKTEGSKQPDPRNTQRK